MSEIPGRYADQFNLRLPDGMRDRLKAAAKENGRSMNAEIVQALEEKYPPPIDVDELKDMIQSRLIILKNYKSGTALSEVKIIIEELFRVLDEKYPPGLKVAVPTRDDD